MKRLLVQVLVAASFALASLPIGLLAEPPVGIPKKVATALAEARKTHPDAVLTAIVYSEGTFVPLSFTFHSPQSHQTQIAFVSGAEVSSRPWAPDTNACCGAPLPLDFIDLSEAIQGARSVGMRDEVRIATLGQTVLTGHRMMPAWRFNGYVVEASSGRHISESQVDDPYRQTEAEFRRQQAERQQQNQQQAQKNSEGSSNKHCGGYVISYWQGVAKQIFLPPCP